MRSKYETLIMFELGIPLDPETERWIVASRQRRAEEEAKAAAVPGRAGRAIVAETRVGGAGFGSANPGNPNPGNPNAGKPSPDTARLAEPIVARRPYAPSRRPTRARPAQRQRLATDYQFFAAERLRIRSKRGAIEPLVFNRAQRHIHAELEAQRAATGKVRALILKGRQQGCSTYVGGRYYHRATHERGLQVFILSHEEQATKNLFEMVERFHDTLRRRRRRPAWPMPASFISTSSTPATRSAPPAPAASGARPPCSCCTAPRWRSGRMRETHAAGVLQAVPDEPGTEVILETTANGVGNLFHKMWRDAEAGLSGYIAIFVPWYWQDEYRRPLKGGPTLRARDAHRRGARLRGALPPRRRADGVAAAEDRRARRRRRCSSRNIRRPPPRRSG